MSRPSFVTVCALSVLVVLTAPALAGGGTPTFAFPVPAGWHMQADTAAYGPENLWEYIDGAADLFVSYGFEELRCATYRSPAGEEIRAEVYRHADPANAYGMYSQERSPENAPVRTGTEGCADAGMMNVVIGRWYVKLSAGASVGTGDLLTIAQALDAALGSPRGLPLEFGLLPAAGRIARSEQYIARDFLGYGFLAKVFLARYGDGEGAQVFVMRTPSPAAAGRVCASFLKVAGIAEAPAASGPLHFTDPHHGPIDLIVRGADVFGIIGCGKNAPLRDNLLKKLQ